MILEIGCIFHFHDTIFPTYPENRNIKVSFCFLNRETETNFFLAGKLKTISMWVCHFYKNCFVDVFLTQNSFLQYKFSFSFCGLIYGLRIFLQLLNVYY